MKPEQLILTGLPLVGLSAIPILNFLLHGVFSWYRRLRITATVFLVWVVVVTPVYVAAARALQGAITRSEEQTAANEREWRYFDEISPSYERGLIQHKARKVALKYNLDPNQFLAQINQESGFNPNAIGAAGEHGLGQIMPVVSDWCGHPHDALFDVDTNLDCAARYMVYLTDYYKGDGFKALAAYNFGPGNVNESLAATGKIPNPHYVNPILANAPNYARPMMPYIATPAETRWGAGAYHSAPMGRDFKAGCGATLIAPISGRVAYAGREFGFIGTHAAKKEGVHRYNTVLTIVGEGDYAGWRFTLLHQNNLVETGDVVIMGVTVIGREATEGNSTGCHTHISVSRWGNVIDYFANWGTR